MKKFFCCWVIATALLCAPVQAAILQIDGGGNLTGAHEVDVGGTLYDVAFLDGTFDSVFGVSGLDATTLAEAAAFSDALLAHVFVGMFDSMPSLTVGCEEPTLCRTLTPYETNATSSLVHIVFNDSVEACIFRPKPITDSAASRSPFRGKPITLGTRADVGLPPRPLAG